MIPDENGRDAANAAAEGTNPNPQQEAGDPVNQNIPTGHRAVFGPLSAAEVAALITAKFDIPTFGWPERIARAAQKMGVDLVDTQTRAIAGNDLAQLMIDLGCAAADLTYAAFPAPRWHPGDVPSFESGPWDAPSRYWFREFAPEGAPFGVRIEVEDIARGGELERGEPRIVAYGNYLDYGATCSLIDALHEAALVLAQIEAEQ